MNAKEILKKLIEAGFYQKSQNGSHIKMTNGEKTTIVPNHGKKDIKIGTVKSIEKYTGVKLL
ncbi:MAG: type II toxin-antitoxin system HicA family toxin [Arcobacter butzleri]|jgi:mRNA interferase HicA|nr:type II toxin-antitoxin system HicA family toxin [Arcobacteraceae bacterium]NLO17994.1 type II toxin-antitoxin system HicA family toxin [Aliarcobacter butzleri]